MKRILFLVVALLLCATVVFVACSDDNFTPLSEKPSGHTPESNGGIAVRYGEWLYYINGYTSDVSASNTYSDDVKSSPRIGSVVRIKLDEIEALFDLSEDDDLEDVDKAVADYVRAHAQTVVPKVYISNNSTERRLTGLYIFDDRIYITTPNDELTPGGNPRTSELDLMSFDLNGANPKKHFTFSDNSVQIWLDKVNGKVVATYLLDSKLHTLDVASGKDTLVTHKEAENTSVETINDVSSVNWDIAGGYVFFINSTGEIGRLAVGATEYDVVVANDTFAIHADHIEEGKTTYSIQSVNNGEVYYTKTNKEESAVRLYWTNGSNGEQIALNSNQDGAIGWKNGQVVYSYSENGYYGIKLTNNADGSGATFVLSREYNENAVTISKVEGDLLYYSANSVYYTIDLANDSAELEKGDAYAKGVTETGWATSDFLTVGDVHYVISVSTSSIKVVKFNPEEETNSDTTVELTLLPA